MIHAFRLAIRRIRNRPGFAATVVITLGLGVGAAAAVFSLVNGVLLTPLPFEEPDRLVMVWERNLPREVERNVTSPANFFLWQDDAESFQDLAAVVQFGSTLVTGGEAERVGAVMVSWPFFGMLGVRPELGRTFVEADGEAGGVVPVVLSHGYWQRRFGGDRDVLGREIALNGDAAEVVGVLPAGFHFDYLEFQFGWDGPQEIWIPVRLPESARTARGRYLQVVGRLAPGVPSARADAEMSTLAARYAQEYPRYQTGWDVSVVPLHQQIVGDVQRALLLVLGAVGLVLLIAAANVTSLQLARALARRQEVAVRVAMGADRKRVVGENLVESLVLALLGGGLGVVLAVAGVEVVRALAPDVPRLDQVEVDLVVLGFALAVAVVAGVLAGVWPALKGSRGRWSEALREGARAGSGRGSVRSRSALVVAEMSLTLVLLVGAGLLIRSFGGMLEEGVGFPTENLLAADLNLDGGDYPGEAERVAFFERVVERVDALPGVSAASAITFLPLSGTGSATSFWANDRPVPEAGEHPVADIRWVHRDYHQTMGIPILSGRGFDTADGRDTPLRVVVNQALVDDLWPDANPIGQSISMPWGDTLVAEVVGVAGDVRIHGPTEPARAMIYWHHQQWTSFTTMTLVARTGGRPEALAPELRALVRELDAGLPLYNVRSVESYLGDAVGRARFAMTVLLVFAGLALLLAAIGTYGVISYSVGQRTREFGIRMTLGARKGDVLRQVLRQGAILAGLALAIGTAGALLATRLLEGFVFGISTTDPITFGATAAVLAVVALVAAWVPAHRASSTDPVRALRHE